MCQRAFHITNGLDNVEQKVLTHPKVRQGRYFGTSVVRPAIIHQLVTKGLAASGGFHPEYGTPRWHLTQCGMNASQLLQDIEANPLLQQAMIDSYEERRSRCPLTVPDAPRKFPFQRNPRSQKIKVRNQSKEKIKEWIEERAINNRPISYRFLARLLESYVERAGITQKQAVEDFRECGIHRILMQPPYHLALPQDDGYELLQWFWGRRDFRTNPYRRNSDASYRLLEREWMQGNMEAGEKLKAIKDRTDPINVIELARDIHFGELPVLITDDHQSNCEECGILLIEAGKASEDDWSHSSFNVDSPVHCAQGENCVDLSHIGWKAGGEPLLVGKLINYGLNFEGEHAVINALKKDPQDPLAQYWAYAYAPYYDEIREIALGLRI